MERGCSAELEELGAEVTVAACDVCDREQLQRPLEAIPGEHPLGAVIHSAAVLDDGVLESLDGERLERVMGPKADAAWHLHELTEGIELSRFVMFSSAAGLLGGAARRTTRAPTHSWTGLAAQRRAEGLPRHLAGMGPLGPAERWAVREMDQAEMARIFVSRFVPASASPRCPKSKAWSSSMLPCPSRSRCSARPRSSAPHSGRRRDRDPAADLAWPCPRTRPGARMAQLAGRAPRRCHADERKGVVIEFVRGHAAAVLGHASAEEAEPDRSFKEIGFDSLAAVELRNRLVAATGLRLPPTLVFDYPFVPAVAEHLLTETGLAGEGPQWGEEA